MSLFLRRLLFFHGNAVRVGIGIVTNTSHFATTLFR